MKIENMIQIAQNTLKTLNLAYQVNPTPTGFCINDPTIKTTKYDTAIYLRKADNTWMVYSNLMKLTLEGFNDCPVQAIMIMIEKIIQGIVADEAMKVYQNEPYLMKQLNAVVDTEDDVK